MNKTENKTYNPIWTSIALNAVALIISLFVYKPFFEENDDAFLSMIAEGAYGVREPHLIYTNIILGHIYKVLYTLCPVVRWHSILQYIFLFTAMCVLTTLLLKGGKPKPRGRFFCHIFSSGISFLAIFLLLSISYEAYVSLQYSKTAALVSAIGYLCLLYTFRPDWSTNAADDCIEPSADDAFTRILACIFLIYGMLLRDSSFMLATLLLIPIGIFSLVRLCGKNTRKPAQIKAFIGFFAAIGCLFLLFIYVDRAAYDKDAAWKDFMEYNGTRMQLLDYRYDLLDYNRYGSRLEGMGVSENDALLYLTWQFGDDKVLSTEKMEEILSGAPKRRINIDLVKGLAQHIYEDVLIFNPLVIGTLFIITALFVMIIRKKDRGLLMMIISQLIIFAGVIVYYEYSGRWSHRIVFAAILIMMVSGVYLLACENWAPGNETSGGDVSGNTAMDNGASDSDISGKVPSAPVFTGGTAAGIIVLLTISCLTVLLGNRLDYNAYRRSTQDYRAFLENTGASDDVLYIADTFTFQKAYRYDVFKPYAQGSLRNFAAVGSWYVNSPITKQITGRFGYDNPYLAFANVADDQGKKGEVILVDNMYVNEKMEFLKEHYSACEAEEIGEEFGFKMYRIK